ncbi:response regulator transcription factor [Noviherbaspirillum pedocola]|uniref:Response regulator transcription factor n=1 Tax=Noviherbaspirillum pedocola TaxID=2801341 RepID=A0A934T116_9BURK|nr:response regulator transcription factor [Noviherbaspirillum pedocola]MBK4738771.1 response regulator transcription factor [Noviherbaspirillum pedocola]
MQLLLVEDDAVLADGIARNLSAQGYEVDVVRNGSDADALLQRREISAVVMDIGIPGLDGFEVVRRMRARGNHTPVLLLTARDAVADRVFGLGIGADDYVVKPFATAELVARVKALVRRGSGRDASIEIGALKLDATARRATVHGMPIDLSARECAILEYLLRNTGRVVSKQQIIDAILPWGEEVTVNAVEVYLSRIRSKLADAGVAIRTVRGFGYMLDAGT